MNLPGDIRERFEAKYVPEPNSGCWLWTAACLKDRYGNPSYGVIGIGVRTRTALAHRVSWQLRFGETPGERLVMHKCDNRLCVNPDHMRLGTYAENNADMRNKGRACHGEKRSALSRRWHATEEGREKFLRTRQRGDRHFRAQQTHCIHGHAFTPENTINRAGGHRGCRECRRIASRECKRRNRAKRQQEIATSIRDVEDCLRAHGVPLRGTVQAT